MAKHYVSFLDTEQYPNDAAELLSAWARRATVSWTVDEKAERGDVVLFYSMAPVSAFFAVGHVIGPDDRTWRGFKCFKLGNLRFFRTPIPLDVAKAHCGMPWLMTPQGFGQGAKDDADLIVRMGVD